MTHSYQVAFWNVENLFDIEDSPRRSEKLQRAIGSDLAGWSQAVLDKKVSQLASIIVQMNDGKGPDVLGVCEVENAHVINLLVEALASLGRNYSVTHADTNDRRGIDVGFIFDADLFTPEAQFSHFVLRRTATRDLLQVNFRTNNDRLLVLVGNHWPSRSGGKEKSQGYRAIAGETLAYFHQRIREVHGDETPVLAMGDFNDEPFDSSLVDYALSTRSRTKVVRATSPRMLNLMWTISNQKIGTFYYNNFPNILDQFLANENLLKTNSPIQVDIDSVEILQPQEMVSHGTYPTPVRYGGIGRKVNPDGYSDHFPIVINLIEED